MRTFRSARSMSNSAMPLVFRNSTSSRNSCKLFWSIFTLPALYERSTGLANSQLQLDPGFRRGRQDLCACLCHKNHILDPDAKPARDINAGFNCNHHSCLELLCLLRSQPGTFVNLKANAVAGGVCE